MMIVMAEVTAILVYDDGDDDGVEPAWFSCESHAHP